MRTIVFFDLPMTTSENIREYNKFRKFLIKSGFMMMQESVYTKILLNTTAVNAVVENIKKNRPKEGLVQVLTVTEKQFSKMEFVVGEKKSDVLDSDERLVIL
ncbi:CRISPR-associated endonuclease Cas2 [Peptacetobacter hominis]|uniref:CRISPR-associated endoribonuclease Cas2 n=1 Tax=Peptacetobacter hominis TaxID=2743610 RepID=A0A544QTI6_9FIRM|nr:CRISPR-associated endonuclease Cas2 [Peptacetobacter hominis]TQQ84003.1 CRISPR-associated endonuclease Cas2 [Peptacetobacter hominis]